MRIDLGLGSCRGEKCLHPVVETLRSQVAGFRDENILRRATLRNDESHADGYIYVCVHILSASLLTVSGSIRIFLNVGVKITSCTIVSVRGTA